MACTPQLVVVRTPATGPGTARSSLESIAIEVMDWDSTHRREGIVGDLPPWISVSRSRNRSRPVSFEPAAAKMSL
jgi:hypothetical protein